MRTIRFKTRRGLCVLFAGVLAGIGVVGDALATAEPAGEIVLGQTYDASRPDLAEIARIHRAYFDRVNAGGGIRGRTVRLVSLDDRGDPVAAARNREELAQRHGAIALFGMPRVAGDGGGDAIPQLFVRDRLAATPGALPFYPDYPLEGRLMAGYIAQRSPGARVAVLMEDGPGARQVLDGLRGELARTPQAVIGKVWQAGPSADALETAVRELKDSGCNALVVLFAGEAVGRVLSMAQDIGWSGLRVVGSDGVRAVRAAPETDRIKARGVESFRYLKDAHDPAWAKRKPFTFAEWSPWDNDRGVQAFVEFLRRHARGADAKSEPVQYAYSTAQLMAHVLARCGDRISRDEVVKQSQRLAGEEVALLSPGIRIYTHPGRHAPITQAQPVRFDGAEWTESGEVVEAADE